ncbi:MAG: hypothetical protein J6V19_04365 [Alistipes sp.]|jgi:hypothetical protein|nr:hypothetical protein [Alistipes sp.]
MNTKWKIALLTLLGFSTAACCNTKKATKSDDGQPQQIVNEQEDPRIMLMYGVPSPDGRVVRPIDENGNPVAENEAVQFPDGGVAKPVTDEQAQQILDAIKAEKEAKAQQSNE